MIAISSTDSKGTDILATQQALNVYPAALLAGELQQFNRLAGGPIVQYSTAGGTTATVAVCASPCIYYGLMIVTTGSGTVNVWDGTSAGTTIMPALTPPTTGGTFWPAAGPGGVGIGIQLNTGLSIQCSTAGTVLYPLIAPST